MFLKIASEPPSLVRVPCERVVSLVRNGEAVRPPSGDCLKMPVVRKFPTECFRLSAIARG